MLLQSVQLQYLVSDESCQECMELLQQEQRRGGAGGLCSTAHQRAAAELAYQRRAEQALADENCFKIYVVCMFIMNRFIFFLS